MGSFISLVVVGACLVAVALVLLRDGDQPATDRPPRHREWLAAVEARRARLRDHLAERAEARRIARQVDAEARAAVQQAEARRAEARRVEAERVEAQRAEARRVEAERAEARRVEAERARARRAEARTGSGRNGGPPAPPAPAVTHPPLPHHDRVRAPEVVRGRPRDLARRPSLLLDDAPSSMVVPSVAVRDEDEARTHWWQRARSVVGVALLVLGLGIAVAAAVGVVVLVVSGAVQDAVR